MRQSQRLFILLLCLSALYFIENLYLSATNQRESIDQPPDEAIKDNTNLLSFFNEAESRGRIISCFVHFLKAMWQNPPLKDATPDNHPLSFANKSPQNNTTQKTQPSHPPATSRTSTITRRTVLSTKEFQQRTRILVLCTSNIEDRLPYIQRTIDSLQISTSPQITLVIPQESTCNNLNFAKDNHIECVSLPYAWKDESQFYHQVFPRLDSFLEEIEWNTNHTFLLFITDSYLASFGWFDYFKNFAVLLEEGVDKPTFGITAWNEYAFPFLASSASAFYRTEVFVGKMWMTSISKLKQIQSSLTDLWDSQSDWEISMEKILLHHFKHIIYPEVSRVSVNILPQNSSSFVGLYGPYKHQNPLSILRSTRKDDNVTFGDVFTYTSQNYVSQLQNYMEYSKKERYLNAVLQPTGKTYPYNAPTVSKGDWFPVLQYLDIIGNHSTRIYNYYRGIMIFRYATNLLILRGMEAQVDGSQKQPDWTVPFNLTKPVGTHNPTGTVARISSVGHSCHDACRTYGEVCEDGHLHILDSCNKLLQYLPCKNGCRHFPALIDSMMWMNGTNYEEYRVNAFAAPLFHPQTGVCMTSSIRNLNCAHSDRSSKRLCLCKQN